MIETQDVARQLEQYKKAQGMDVKDPWRHRSQGMKCRSCMWFVLKPVKEIVSPELVSNYLGRCRRHAPTMNGYPAVFEEDWCGDHKLDENKL